MQAKLEAVYELTEWIEGFLRFMSYSYHNQRRRLKTASFPGPFQKPLVEFKPPRQRLFFDLSIAISTAFFPSQDPYN